MEYYKKSLRLLKIMLAFVIICVIYAIMVQPQINILPKLPQPKQQMNGNMPDGSAIPDNLEINMQQNNINVAEEEFVSRAFVQYKRVHPELDPQKEAEILEALRTEYKAQMGNSGQNQQPQRNIQPPSAHAARISESEIEIIPEENPIPENEINPIPENETEAIPENE